METQRSFGATPPLRRAYLPLAAIVLLALIPIAFFVISSLGAPRPVRYEIERGLLKIITVEGFTGDTKSISLGRIDEASAAWLRGGKLRFGSVRPGYCVGFFTYSSIGEVWQATDCSDAGVLLRAGGEIMPVVLAPAMRDEFLSAIKEGREGRFTTARRPTGVSIGPLAIMLAICWPGAALLAAVFYVAPARLRYRITADAVEVSGLFVKHRFPLANARVRPFRPLVGRRLSGIRVPGYVSGVMAYDEAPTSVFATHQDEGVLLEADERLFITPHDRDRFLASVPSTRPPG